MKEKESHFAEVCRQEASNEPEIGLCAWGKSSSFIDNFMLIINFRKCQSCD